MAGPAGIGSADSSSVTRGGHGYCVEPQMGSEVCVTPDDAELRSWPIGSKKL
ncbi:hypothetical protein HNP40_002144 [Mycobacteroides chelonae]|nr:hypothetical protein [Mycobacteroides chelonae]